MNLYLYLDFDFGSSSGSGSGRTLAAECPAPRFPSSQKDPR